MLKSTESRRRRLAPLVAGRVAPPINQVANPDLVISAVSSFPLREPASRRRYTILELQTKSGLTGYGECREISSDHLAQARQSVVGWAATAFEVLRHQLESLPGVQAALNMALLDLLGKSVRAPVYQILGGPTRFKARVMTALDGETDEDLLATLQRARAAGFRAFLVPLPAVARRKGGREMVRMTQRRLEALRTAGGESSDFALAGTGDLPAQEATALAEALEGFSLLWFDEACGASHLTSLRTMAGMFVTPLGFGRGIRESSGFLDLLREGVVDVIRPDLNLCGILQARRMAALAETYYVAVAPRHEGGPIATAASLHLAASLPNFFIQQVPFSEAEEDRRMRADLAGAPIEKVEEGFVKLPAGDGLGITVHEEALEKFKEGAS